MTALTFRGTQQRMLYTISFHAAAYTGSTDKAVIICHIILGLRLAIVGAIVLLHKLLRLRIQPQRKFVFVLKTHFSPPTPVFNRKIRAFRAHNPEIILTFDLQPRFPIPRKCLFAVGFSVRRNCADAGALASGSQILVTDRPTSERFSLHHPHFHVRLLYLLLCKHPLKQRLVIAIAVAVVVPTQRRAAQKVDIPDNNCSA